MCGNLFLRSKILNSSTNLAPPDDKSDSLWNGDLSDCVKRVRVPAGQDDHMLGHVALVSLGYFDGQMLEAYVVFKA